MSSRNRLFGFAVWIVPLGLLYSGCAPQGGGAAGARGLAVSTGDAGAIEVAPNTAAEGMATAELPGAPPANVRSGRVSVTADNIQFVEAAAKSRPLMQADPRKADVTIHIAGENEAEPCAHEFQVLSFTATEDDAGILLSDASASLSPSALALVVSGQFVFCIEIVANFSGTVIISDIDFELSDTDDGGDDDDLDTNGDDEDGDEEDENDLNDNKDDNDNGDNDTDDVKDDDLNDNADGDLDDPDDGNLIDSGGDGHDHHHPGRGADGSVNDYPGSL